MAAVAALPSLSELMAWPTDHLMEAAEQWEAVAERNYGVANQVWRDALSVDWHGDAADALRAATHSDMSASSAAADQLHTAAGVARSGASDLYSAQSRLRYAIDDAQAAGYDVDEEGSVIDRSGGGSAAQRAARLAEAQTLAGEIRQRAVQLVAVDQEVAGKVTAAVAGIRDTFKQQPDARAVDNHTFKQDPVPRDPNAETPWRERPSPRTAQDVQDALLQLQRGVNKPNRQLDSPEEVEEFWDWLSKNGRDLPSPGSVIRKVLDDGTEISVRPTSDSGGPTVGVTFPDGGRERKVHLPLSPVTSAPPQVPQFGHPSAEPPLYEPGHPLPAPLPPTQFADPADLPPWLRDPSPPGFTISPVQRPPAFDWNQPNTPPVPNQAPSTSGQPPWPQFGHDLAEAGKKTFQWIVVGGIVVGGLLTAGGRLTNGGPLETAPAP